MDENIPVPEIPEPVSPIEKAKGLLCEIMESIVENSSKKKPGFKNSITSHQVIKIDNIAPGVTVNIGDVNMSLDVTIVDIWDKANEALEVLESVRVIENGEKYATLKLSYHDSMRKHQYHMVRLALRKARNRSEAIKMLGISRQFFYDIIHEMKEGGIYANSRKCNQRVGKIKKIRGQSIDP